MSNVLSNLKYTATHEWVRLDEDGSVTIGITDHAQDLLGDVVFVELPEIDIEIQAEQEIGVIESVKAASDIYSPIAGTLVAINPVLTNNPELINSDPYGEGWLVRIEPDDEQDLEALLNSEAYAAQIAAEGH